jgi:hypothetical protein
MSSQHATSLLGLGILGLASLPPDHMSDSWILALDLTFLVSCFSWVDVPQ